MTNFCNNKPIVLYVTVFLENKMRAEPAKIVFLAKSQKEEKIINLNLRHWLFAKFKFSCCDLP